MATAKQRRILTDMQADALACYGNVHQVDVVRLPTGRICAGVWVRRMDGKLAKVRAAVIGVRGRLDKSP